VNGGLLGDGLPIFHSSMRTVTSKGPSL
jgi:hypothetical protein